MGYPKKPIVRIPGGGTGKTCSRCHELRPLEQYYYHAKRSRYGSLCKDCERERDKAQKAKSNAPRISIPIVRYRRNGKSLRREDALAMPVSCDTCAFINSCRRKYSVPVHMAAEDDPPCFADSRCHILFVLRYRRNDEIRMVKT